ncbi:hypothetical protein ABK040_007503 [Willaertia magna]
MQRQQRLLSSVFKLSKSNKTLFNFKNKCNCSRTIYTCPVNMPKTNPENLMKREDNPLSDEVTLLVRIVADVASGNYTSLITNWQYLLCTYGDAHKMPQIALELVSQTHAMCGFPKILNSLSAMHNDYVSNSTNKEEAENYWTKVLVSPESQPMSLLQEEEEGGVALNAIYGQRGAKRLVEKMAVIHPMMNSYMIDHAYGTVLQPRKHVFLPLRELACIMALCYEAQIQKPQLASHMRGFLRMYRVENELLYSIPIVRPSISEAVSSIQEEEVIPRKCLQQLLQFAPEFYNKPELSKAIETVWGKFQEHGVFTL